MNDSGKWEMENHQVHTLFVSSVLRVEGEGAGDGRVVVDETTSTTGCVNSPLMGFSKA